MLAAVSVFSQLLQDTVSSCGPRQYTPIVGPGTNRVVRRRNSLVPAQQLKFMEAFHFVKVHIFAAAAAALAAAGLAAVVSNSRSSRILSAR